MTQDQITAQIVPIVEVGFAEEVHQKVFAHTVAVEGCFIFSFFGGKANIADHIVVACFHNHAFVTGIFDHGGDNGDVCFVFGVVQCIAYEKARSLWLPIMIHFIFNALNVAGVLLFMQA